jgi:pilus assembly protein CpaE
MDCKDDAMTSTDRSIVLISEDPAFTERMAALLRATPGRSVTQCNATLASMNGKASEFARQSELIIFQAQPDDSSDIAALHDISQAGGTARFLAISDSKASLAMAHTLMRAGVAEVVPDTLADDEIDSIVARLSMPRRLSLAPVTPREGQVIAVAKARGGIGATTLAVNLADAMTRRPRRFGRAAETGRHVALVDLDLQFGAVAGFLDLPPSDAFYRVAREHFDPDAVFLDQSVVTLPGGLAVLTAPEGFMPVTSVTPEQIRALVQRLRQKYDFVVIDLPQVMVDWLTPVLEAASRVFVVTGLSVPFIQQSRRLIDFYKDQNPALEVEIVIGKEKKPLLGSRRQTEAEKALGQKFRHWLPREERVAGDAMDQGRPLSQSAPGSALGKSIARMAAEILKAAETPAAQAGRNTAK